MGGFFVVVVSGGFFIIFLSCADARFPTLPCNKQLLPGASPIFIGLRNFQRTERNFKTNMSLKKWMILFLPLKCLGDSCCECSDLSLFSSGVASPCKL